MTLLLAPSKAQAPMLQVMLPDLIAYRSKYARPAKDWTAVEVELERILEERKKGAK